MYSGLDRYWPALTSPDQYAPIYIAVIFLEDSHFTGIKAEISHANTSPASARLLTSSVTFPT